MGNDHHRGPALLELHDAIGESRIAFGIQVRTWFVENDQAGIAIHRARKAQTLAKAAGESGAAVPHLGVIACRQSQDHVMYPGHPGGEDCLVIPALLETADIGRNRIGE